MKPLFVLFLAGGVACGFLGGCARKKPAAVADLGGRGTPDPVYVPSPLPAIEDPAPGLADPSAVLPPLPGGPAGLSGSSVPEKTSDYTGPLVCGECHKERLKTFQQTAHYLTMRPAIAGSLKADFRSGHNRVDVEQAGVSFVMEARGDMLFLDKRDDAGTRERVRMDFVIGSGRKGEAFVRFDGDALVRLPVAYVTPASRWAVGGGNVNPAPVTPECLNCHATVFDWVPRSMNRYGRSGYVLGVTCERCHGPARRHVEYHRAHRNQPDGEQAHFILNPGEVSPEAQSELCAQCHGGGGSLLRPAFSFRAGDRLSSLMSEARPEENRSAHSDNELLRVRLSRCWKESPSSMTCMTCHNPHVLERGDRALFSRRCLSCHGGRDPGSKQCPLKKRLGARIERNCIDCHMKVREDAPLAESERTEGLQLPTIRDHLIGIYPEETRRFLAGPGGK